MSEKLKLYGKTVESVAECDFNNASIKQTGMENIVISESNMTGCELERVNISYADFKASDISNADFRERAQISLFSQASTWSLHCAAHRESSQSLRRPPRLCIAFRTFLKFAIKAPARAALKQIENPAQQKRPASPPAESAPFEGGKIPRASPQDRCADMRKRYKRKNFQSKENARAFHADTTSSACGGIIKTFVPQTAGQTGST